MNRIIKVWWVGVLGIMLYCATVGGQTYTYTHNSDLTVDMEVWPDTLEWAIETASSNVFQYTNQVNPYRFVDNILITNSELSRYIVMTGIFASAASSQLLSPTGIPVVSIATNFAAFGLFVSNMVGGSQRGAFTMVDNSKQYVLDWDTSWSMMFTNLGVVQLGSTDPDVQEMFGYIRAMLLVGCLVGFAWKCCDIAGMMGGDA